MVARLTPDQKAACSNHVGVKFSFGQIYSPPSMTKQNELLNPTQIPPLSGNAILGFREHLRNVKCCLPLTLTPPKILPLPLFSTFAAAAASIHFWVPFYSRSNGPHQCPKHRVFPVDVDVESANNPYTTVTHFTGFSGKEVAGRLFVASEAGFLKTQWSNKWAS